MAKKAKKVRKSTKEAKFFCESCGNEVPRNARVCPTCGKFFASVRCPQCGRTGTNDDFKTGCPDCGYAVNPDTMYGGYIPPAKSNIKYKNNGNGRGAFGRSKTAAAYSDSSLPVWVYVFTIMVLTILVILLYSCLK